MVDGMVLRRLDETKPLQGSNEPWEIFRRGMGPTVNGVDVHPKQREEEKLPPEKAQQRPGSENGQRNENRWTRGFPEGDPRDVAGAMMMQDVLADGVPNERRGLRTVPILGPVDDARNEVHQQVDPDGLSNHQPPWPLWDQHGRVEQHDTTHRTRAYKRGAETTSAHVKRGPVAPAHTLNVR